MMGFLCFVVVLRQSPYVVLAVLALCCIDRTRLSLPPRMLGLKSCDNPSWLISMLGVVILTRLLWKTCQR